MRYNRRMLLMGSKPESWPIVKDPPCEMGEVVGTTHGIVDGWNDLALVRKGANGKLWANDDSGGFDLSADRLYHVLVSKHDPKLTPNGLMVAREALTEYEADPDSYARAAEARLSAPDRNNVCYTEGNAKTVDRTMAFYAAIPWAPLPF